MLKITKAARDESCVRCGTNDGTIVACHINGRLAPVSYTHLTLPTILLV